MVCTFLKMEFTFCDLVPQRTWPYTVSPFHLLVDKVKWNTRFVGGCDSSCIISLFDRRHASSTRPGLFAVVHLDNRSTDLEKDAFIDIDGYQEDFPQPLDLFCTREFVEHYNLQNSLTDLSFACVNAFPLQQVIIGAETDEAFQWTQNQSFETGLIVSASSCTRSLLVRSNDIFLSSPSSAYGSSQADIIKKFKQLHVMKCSPIEQGLLTINTSVVFVRPQKPFKSVEHSTNASPASCNSYDVQLFDLWPHHVDSISSASEYAKYASKIFASETVAKSLNVQTNDLILVKVKPIEDTRIAEQDKFNFDQRPFTFEVVPENFSPKLKSSCKYSNPNAHDKALKFSSTAWFNIMGEKHMHRVHPSKCTFELQKMERDGVEFAKEIHFSLILSPNYSPSGCFDKSLVKYFKDAQLLRVGDVISINVEDDYDYYGATDVHFHRCRLLYYKVMKMNQDTKDSQCYLVDASRTSFYQDGTTNSFIPVLQTTKHYVDVTSSITSDTLPGLSKYVDEMCNIITPYLVENSQFDHSCSLLLSGQSGCGKRSIINAVCKACNIHLVEIECHSLLSDTSGASEAKINEAFRRASVYTPCAILLSGIDGVGMNRETNRTDNRVSAALCKAIDALPRREGKTMPAVVIATTYDKDDVVADVRMQFLHQIAVESPTEADRLRMILEASKQHIMSADIDYQWLAKHTAGFVYGDIWELMRKTTQVTYTRTIDQCAVGSKLSWREEECVAMAGITSSHDDIAKALQQMQADRADTIGVPKIPDVDWKDIGGLEEVKSHILDTIQLPLDHPELVSTGLRRSGVLLYGPPGTGKTLLAKAVASQCSLSFLSVKGPELINMYVGQSEANVRRVFQRARDAAPCVVFFDELDALAPNRGRSGDSGGVMDRVVSQLLAELDGVNSGDSADKQVFIIAASNRPDLIDQALLRPGRLDKLLYVGISDNKIDRLKVLEAQTRKMNLSPLVNLDEVVTACPANMTGADFYGLTSEAALNAVRRHIEDAEAGKTATGQCVIEQGDFLDAASRVLPSLTDLQLENYKRVKAVMLR